VLNFSLGGLQEGLAVELANGSMAVVVEAPCRVLLLRDRIDQPLLVLLLLLLH
jgi:hypothetical protein